MGERSQRPLRVVVWSEYLHERRSDLVGRIYPEGMHEAIAVGLRSRLPAATVSTATLAEVDHGLSSQPIKGCAKLKKCPTSCGIILSDVR